MIKALKSHYPHLKIEGIGGPQLIREGCVSLAPMERLAVMGLIEPLKRLPELLSIRKRLKKYFIQNPPDLFIGVDAPDFNLNLEKSLHEKGIPTVHYVSPSVWAWRQNRIHAIKKSVDLMLTLLPFEASFYKQHEIPVCFVGHPLADAIPLQIDVARAKKMLNLQCNVETKCVALLPGSRTSELKYMSALYCQTARLLHEQYLATHPSTTVEFLVPLVSEAHRVYFNAIAKQYAPNVQFKVFLNHVREIIAAADVVLVTSGTATLEVMLHKKPMVVAYCMHPLTYKIVDRLVKVPYVALPNLLAQEFLVPEFIQNHATPKALKHMLWHYLHAPKECERLHQRFTELHRSLQQGGSIAGANAILKQFA